MTNIYLITGFLGAGKTTFLNERLLDSHGKTGVLMNEFGKVSMDSIIVKDLTGEFIELKNGSIFCSCLKEHFIEGLKKLILMDLDDLYIESSGLADPSDMGKILSVIEAEIGDSKFIFKGTVCIVDGLYFKLELEKMVSVAKQIRHSHHVLVNKSDLINTNQLLEVIELIKNINPLVGITPISYGHVNFEKLKLEYYHIEDEVSINTVDNKPKSFLMKFIKEPTTQQLKEFLEQMPDYFYRIKGFIQITGIWYKVDLVNTQIEISPIEMKHFSNQKVIDQQVTDQQTTDFQGTNQQVIATKSDTNSEGFNELILLAAKGISSMSHMLEIAEKLLPNLYEIQV